MLTRHAQSQYERRSTLSAHSQVTRDKDHKTEIGHSAMHRAFTIAQIKGWCITVDVKCLYRAFRGVEYTAHQKSRERWSSLYLGVLASASDRMLHDEFLSQ